MHCLTLSAILSPVSERKNNMKNQMTIAELRRYSQDKAKRLKARAEAIQKNIDKQTNRNDMKNQTIIAAPSVKHDGYRDIAPLVVQNPKVLVACCGCGEEIRITHEEASEWIDIDRFRCHECE